MNVVSLVGNLATDVETKTTTSGKTVANFNVAVNRVGEGADFFRVVVFDKQAENCANYLTKGKKVAVAGRLNSNTWETEEGAKRTSIDIVAHNVEFLSPKSIESSDVTAQDDIPF